MERWCEGRGRPRGAVLSLDTVWDLARAWYGDRLAPEFRGRSGEDALAILRGLGLQPPFWSL